MYSVLTLIMKIIFLSAAGFLCLVFSANASENNWKSSKWLVDADEKYFDVNKNQLKKAIC